MNEPTPEALEVSHTVIVEHWARETKEQTHRRYYDAFHAWFMQSSCDFWNECDAPEYLAQIAVEIQDAALRAAEAGARRAALIEMTAECDRIKALFPGYEKHGTYNPSDARNVYEMACDRLRATICAFTSSPAAASPRREIGTLELLAKVIVEGDRAFSSGEWEEALCKAERIHRAALPSPPASEGTKP